MKKIFFGILIFLFLFTQVNAIVVEDIKTQIQSGNEDILKSNAEMTAQITALRTELQNVNIELQNLQEKSVSKSDLPVIYDTIQEIDRDANAQMLATMLAVVVFVFAGLFMSKAKGWL